MDWKECLNKRIIKDVSKDEFLIKSLLNSSQKKLESETRLELDDTTAESKVSLAYDSLRELLEALALLKGYKVYNHDCYTAFLKEVLNESAKGDEFDAIRKIRNSVNYYGKELSAEEGKIVIEKIKVLRSFVYNLLKK